jgi:hypothetical protein
MVAYSFGLVGQLGKNRDTFSQSTPPFSFVYPQLSAISPLGAGGEVFQPEVDLRFLLAHPPRPQPLDKNPQAVLR